MLLTLALAGTIVLTIGGPMIRLLRRMKIGDMPEADHARLNQINKLKWDTPTMGGLLIVGAIVVASVIASMVSMFLEVTQSMGTGFSFVLLASLGVLLALASVGAIDDINKLRNARRRLSGETVSSTRQGLSARSKFLAQWIIGLAGAGVLVTFAPETLAQRVPFFDGPLVLPAWGGVVIFALVIVATSNAVNLSDGLDTLSSGCVVISATGLFAIFMIGAEAGLSIDPGLWIVCGALLGACFAFLHFNRFPARVFMGDTGSLALGGLLGMLACAGGVVVLLPLLGIVYVIEAGSVILQVGYFKWTRRRTGTGRRIFRMTPFHHHIQLGPTEPHETRVTRLMHAIAFIGMLLAVAIALG
jgi:phospho-N-acetylmuramoyl-pentapeptide-transferase